MYPIKLGFSEAESRIRKLIENGHHAEALITSVFSFEKTVRRSLKFCAISRGFTSKQAERLFEGYGFSNMKEVWSCFDPSHDTLVELIGNTHWQVISKAVTMRNKLAHGQRVYKLEECRTMAEGMLDALNSLKMTLSKNLGYDGWTRLPVRRVSALTWITCKPKFSTVSAAQKGPGSH